MQANQTSNVGNARRSVVMTVMLAGAVFACGCSSTGSGVGAGGSTGSGGAAPGGGNGNGGSGGPGGTTAPGGAGGSGGAGTGGATTGGGAGGATAGVGGSSGTGGAAGTGAAGTSGSPTVRLDQAQQTIDGFGINNVFAPAMTDAVADRLFSTTAGIGLSIMRVGMSNGNVLGSDTPGDITKAKARGVTYIIGSVWSPPANCKTPVVLRGQTGAAMSTLNGGHLMASCYDSWSTTITNFARNNGLYAMSLANEPDFQSCGTAEPCNGYYDTTVYTANEMVAFVKVAAPKLKAAGIKVIAPEPSEWVHLWSNTSATGSQPSNLNSSDPLNCGFPATSATCASGGGYDYGHYLFKDATAWAAVDILGVHQYDTQKAEPWPADVTAKKPVWETEMSGVKWWAEQGPSSDITDGLVVAGWIHDAIVNGPASAWLWWWYQSQGTNDNEGLVLQAATGGAVAKRLYTLGNFSKFIRPNYVRVTVSGTIPANVLLTAYKGADGTVVVVAINKGTAAVNVPITISGGTAPASLTPWVTSSADNLASKTAVAVTGGSFTAALAATTVTTFVGK